jgi:hypothetical protein
MQLASMKRSVPVPVKVRDVAECSLLVVPTLCGAGSGSGLELAWLLHCEHALSWKMLKYPTTSSFREDFFFSQFAA